VHRLSVIISDSLFVRRTPSWHLTHSLFLSITQAETRVQEEALKRERSRSQMSLPGAAQLSVDGGDAGNGATPAPAGHGSTIPGTARILSIVVLACGFLMPYSLLMVSPCCTRHRIAVDTGSGGAERSVPASPASDIGGGVDSVEKERQITQRGRGRRKGVSAEPVSDTGGGGTGFQ